MQSAMKIWKPGILFLLTMAPLWLHAQYFSMGQDPASIRWRQLKSQHFNVIFPAENETESRRLIFLLESYYPAVSKGLNHRPGKTNVILHPTSVMSNGIVSWAPKRMELYPCPPQGSYPQEWLEQLALHEFRHVVQISKMNQGFTHGLNLLLGQQASSLVLGLFIPSWFLEGDAVATETSLSPSGRGSFPIFETELRSQLVEKGIYSYDKAVLGSFKDQIPDRYLLGYHIIGYGRTIYGDTLWQNALNRTARYPFLITPFSQGIKHVSGLSKDKFYHRAMLSFDSLWTSLDKKNTPTPNQIQQPKSPLPYSDYHFPAMMEDGSIFCLRIGMNDIPRFVSFRPGGKERILYTPGDLAQDAVEYLAQKIVWTEEIPDLRWDNRSYSVVKIHDLKTGKTKILGRHSRYFAASPSGDFSQIVLAENTETGQNSIVILNTRDGSASFRYQSANNEQFLTPVFDDTGLKILSIALNEYGKRIVEIDIAKKQLKSLTKASYIEISGPVYGDHKIIYTAAYNGLDGIYSLDTTNNQIRQLVAARFGLKDVGFIGNDTLLFSTFQHGSHRATLACPGQGEVTSLQDPPRFGTRLDASLRSLEGPLVFSNKTLQDSILKIKTRPYHKFFHLLDFHSWAPAFVDAGNQNINPGFQLLSQNMLSTSTLSVGWEYLRAEQLGRMKVDYTYAGWFPLLDLKFEDGQRAFNMLNGGKSHRYTYKETDLSLQLSLPLNFSRNKYLRFFQAYAGSTLKIVKKTDNSPANLFEGNIHSLEWGFYAYNILRFTNKDIFPVWGQTLNLNVKQTPWGDASYGDVSCVTGNLFFPGIVRHHGIKLKAAYQIEGIGEYYFSDLISLPRGYPYNNITGFFTSSLDYAFPLLYPDLSIPGFTYIKRLKAAVFVDVAREIPTFSAKDFLSTGMDVTADLHFFRFYAPLELGLRTIYVKNTKELQFEFLWSIGLGAYGGKQDLRKFVH